MFGVVQGTNDCSGPKVRPIDDLTASLANEAVHVFFGSTGVLALKAPSLSRNCHSQCPSPPGGTRKSCKDKRQIDRSVRGVPTVLPHNCLL